MSAPIISPIRTLADAPDLTGSDLTGKTAVVTGATGGLGFETALALARLGATTILAGRNQHKGLRALSRILREKPAANARFEPLDLASLSSISRFASAIHAAGNRPVDILVNNAAVMGLPNRQLTDDGLERQVGVNYLGHFALTAQLKDLLCAAAGGGRVVSVASLAHRRATLGLKDFQSEQSYSPMGAYGRSKLAMLMFALELQRRAQQGNWNLLSIAAHPGWARTDIIPNGLGSGTSGLKARLVDLAFGLVAQPARDGALPLLFAAVAPQAKGGCYYGPTLWNERRGPPGLSRISPQAADPVSARHLWSLSETLTGQSMG